MSRFNELLNDIANQSNDNEGVKGQWIKAVKHSRMYNDRHPNHDDIKGWKWFKEVINIQDSKIVIFKIGNRNWFVLSEFENEFKEKISKSS